MKSLRLARCGTFRCWLCSGRRRRAQIVEWPARAWKAIGVVTQRPGKSERVRWGLLLATLQRPSHMLLTHRLRPHQAWRRCPATRSTTSVLACKERSRSRRHRGGSTLLNMSGRGRVLKACVKGAVLQDRKNVQLAAFHCNEVSHVLAGVPLAAAAGQPALPALPARCNLPQGHQHVAV